MADAAVLKDFLVSLGFKIDAASSTAFTNSITFKTNQIVEFAKTVESVAVKVVAGVGQIASELENLYFASQRTGASAENIRALGFAAERLGSSVGGARSSLEAFRTFLGANPGADSLLASLGIDSNQDTERKLEQFGDYLKTLPEYLQRARAAQFGIEWHTALTLMSDDFRILRDYQEKLFSQFGINQKQATQEAHQFENQISYLSTVFESARIKITTILQQRLGVVVMRFREFLEDNFDKITLATESVGRVLFFIADKALNVFTTVGQDITDLINWWKQLDPVQKETIETFGKITLGLLALNRAFLLNPILLFGAAILLLVDDFAAWKRGSEHLIDWDRWKPGLDLAYKGIKILGEWLAWGVEKLGGIQTVAEGIIIFMATRWAVAVAGWATGVVASFSAMVAAISPFAAALAAIIALGILFDKIFSSDRVRAFIYDKLPGAEAASKFLYDHTGGHIGKNQEEIDEIKKRAATGQTQDNDDNLTGYIKKFVSQQLESIPGANNAGRTISNSGGLAGGGGTGNTIGERLNNPLNLTALPGQATGENTRFRKFDSIADGIQAAANQLRINQSRHGTLTLAQEITRWAPPGENNTAAYIANVAKELNVDPNAPINVSDPATLRALIRAMAHVEIGPKFTLSDQDLALGVPSGPALTPQPSVANTNQQTPPLTVPELSSQNNGASNTNLETTFNLYGIDGNNSHAIAQQVVEEQRKLLLEYQRNSQSAVR